MERGTGWALLLFSCVLSIEARAHPPADDFLNPQDPGARLTLMPFVGPGFRAVYDHRLQVEKDMSEVRTQLMGTVAVPFSEVSANIDARFFLMTFGASAGYHDEWRLLAFKPDPETGRDRAGQPPGPEPPGQTLPPDRDPTTTFVDLDRNARAMKDQTGDIGHGVWPFYEFRWGFVWPAYNFMGVSTLVARHDGRPDVSFDWENGTVSGNGWHGRWETYLLLRGRNLGFIGPALRSLYLPRNRVQGNPTIGTYEVVVPDGSACQMDEGIPCSRRYELDFQYGILAGLQPNWNDDGDTFLIRVYSTWGLDNKLFGTHTFHQPLQILVAYMADIDL
jgi:hypothetical protein